MSHRLGLTEAPPEGLALGVHGPVLERFDDAAALAAALPAVCEYHLTQTSLSETGTSEFNADYDLVPIDVLLLGELLRRSARALPAIDHPLMATPFATLPAGSTCDPLKDARAELWELFLELCRGKRPDLVLS
ncbi:MAG: hypothetical protein IT373_24670 [Polyangiaceae bacterium]|nr:hypothetical protein [Polyangiaceae bacterium]